MTTGHHQVKLTYSPSPVISTSVCLFEFVRSFLWKSFYEGSVYVELFRGHTYRAVLRCPWTLGRVHPTTWIFVSGLCNCTNTSCNLIKKLITKFRGAFMNNICMFSHLQSQLCLYHSFRVAVQTSIINNPQSLNTGCHCGQFTWFSQHLETVFLTSSTQVFSLPCQLLEGKNNFILVWGVSKVMWGEA